jgi:hypothetical protein
MQKMRHDKGDAYKTDKHYKQMLEKRNKMMSNLQWQEFMSIIEKYTV